MSFRPSTPESCRWNRASGPVRSRTSAQPVRFTPATSCLVRIAILALALPFLTTSCGKPGHDHAHDHEKPAGAISSKKHGHAHTPPHGGTPVVLGDETYHLELVHDAGRGVLQAFILDGHLENFIRSAAPSFEIVATVNGEKRPLIFLPVADAATGEKPGDASLFEARADWLKTTAEFDAVLTSLDIRGTTFAGVTFRFPQGHAD